MRCCGFGFLWLDMVVLFFSFGQRWRSTWNAVHFFLHGFPVFSAGEKRWLHCSCVSQGREL